MRRLEDIKNVIIPHFIKYPLRTTKLIDFTLLYGNNVYN